MHFFVAQLFFIAVIIETHVVRNLRPMNRLISHVVTYIIY